MQYREAHPREARSYQLKDIYGITVDGYDRMYESQNGCCKICGKYYEKLSIDHCHISDKVRDLLCCCCNAFIGMAKEDTEILNSAIEYINRHGNVAMLKKRPVK